MIHLHEIIDQAQSEGGFDVSSVIEDEYVDPIMTCFVINSNNATCFDMGEISQTPRLNEWPHVEHLPFDVCYFEGRSNKPDGNTVRIGFFCIETFEDDNTRRWEITIFQKCIDGRWCLVEHVGHHPDEREHDGEYVHFLRRTHADNEEHERAFRVNYFWLWTFLAVLNCGNINRRERLPPRQMRRHPTPGKQPPFSWWTLHIDVPGTKPTRKEAGGGSHSSPRVHLRRGHIRQYAPEKYCWVQQCVVGKKELGMVHKNYNVRINEGE